VIYRHQKPNARLAPFVELFWYWRDDFPQNLKERVLPGAGVEFVIRLTRNLTTISGPHSQYFVLDKSEQDELLGAHFRPGGAFALFGIPLSDMANVHLSLEDICGRESELLRERILHFPSVESRFAAMEAWLTARLDAQPVLHPAVKYALTNAGGMSVGELAENVNLSTRRLTQLFTREVGLTPKLFARIERFQQVVRQIAAAKEINWLEIALRCGYYDQAHFNHDFQEFSGINPTTYLAKRPENLFHVPL